MNQKAHNFKDLTGKVFGRLTVLRIGPKHPKYNRWQWYCKCTCGNEVLISGGYCLTGGNSRSCGCATDEARKINKVTHGHSKDRLYKRWKNIKNRCFNPNTPDYKDYGARGISLYSPWIENFELFRNYLTELYPDIENLLSRGYTLDRIDNNKNYDPGNIRIVTNTVNAGNKRRSYKITLLGKTQSLKTWVKELNLGNYSHIKTKFLKDPLKAFNLSPLEYRCTELPCRQYVIELRELAV